MTREWTLWLVAAVYLAGCLTLGGASAAGVVVNALLQVAAVLLIVGTLWMRDRVPIPSEARTLGWIAAALLLLGGLSLLPLPPSIWTNLPFRDRVEDGLGLLGVTPGWMPLSLAPPATMASLLSVLPPAAMFLLVLQLPQDHRRRLAALVIGIAAVSLCLGAFQLLGGERSPLRFYRITNTDAPVGFFANANHQATLLLVAVALTGFLAAKFASKRSRRSKRSGGAIMTIAIGIFLTIGIILVGSIAGYGLYFPAALASLLVYRRAAYGRIGGRWLAALAVLFVAFSAAALFGPFGNQSLAGKLGEQPTSRRVIAATTMGAIADSFPVGTGLGTFANVYRRYEDPAQARREFVNHAHNDYLEVALELGLAGLILILAFMWWWVRRSIHAWTNEYSGADLARAGSVAIGIVLLHSLVDYPVRTAAIAVLVAMACAFMVPHSPRPKPSPRRQEDESEPLRHLEAV